MGTVEENRKAVAKIFKDFVEERGPTFDHLSERGLITPNQLETLKNAAESVVHYFFWPHPEPRHTELDDYCFCWMMFEMITTIAALKGLWPYYFEHKPKPSNERLLSDRVNPLRLTKGVNAGEMLCQNIQTGAFKIKTLPNHASAGNLNELAGLYFEILGAVFPDAPILDAQTAFAAWSMSFGNELLSKETRAALSPRVAEKYKPYRAALIALTKCFAALECKLNNDLKMAALKKKEEEARKALNEIQAEPEEPEAQPLPPEMANSPVQEYADQLLASADEPKVGKTPLSKVMTRQSLEEARSEYRTRALGIFDDGYLGGTHIASLTKQLKRDAAKIKDNEVSPSPFEDEEPEQVAATLALTGVVYAGEYTWRGKGGNMPGDPRLDAEQVPETTEETKLREGLIAAMIEYANAGAAKARDLQASDVKAKFIEVSTALETNFGRDPDDGFTKVDAEKIVTNFTEGSRLLYGEVQAYLISKGEVLSAERQERLLERLNDSLKNMEDVTAPVFLDIHKERDRNRKIERVLSAMNVIGVQLQETFMPLALEYGVAEEAPIYDETRVTVLLRRLVEEVFEKTSVEYTSCEKELDDLGEILAHPMSKRHPDVFVGKNENGDCIVYLPTPYSTLVKLIEGKKPVEPQPSAQAGLLPKDAVDAITKAVEKESAKVRNTVKNEVRSLKPHVSDDLLNPPPKPGDFPLGKAFRFVKRANRDEKIVIMNVKWNGVHQEHTFHITNPDQWKVVRQLVTSDVVKVKIDKTLIGNRSMGNIFRSKEGWAFYQYMGVNIAGPSTTWTLYNSPQDHSKE